MDASLLPAGQPFTADRAIPGEIDTVERDVHDAYGLAARLLASFVALALLIGAFHVLAPSAESSARGEGTGRTASVRGVAQPSLTPFSAATWSESIGR